jgi:hypothetical protein
MKTSLGRPGGLYSKAVLAQVRLKHMCTVYTVPGRFKWEKMGLQNCRCAAGRCLAAGMALTGLHGKVHALIVPWYAVLCVVRLAGEMV